MAPMLRVLDPGSGATIQDLGRPGWFSAGVGVSGAADAASLRLANRLVANDEGDAGIECVLGGLQVEALTSVTLAVTGATAPLSVDDTAVGLNAVLHLRPGQSLRVGLATAGLRVYVAVRGGLAVEPVLGSRSRDTLAGIGPEPLRAGDELPVGPSPADWPTTDLAPLAPPAAGPLSARVRLGPRDDWFTRPEDLFEGHWLVSDRLDRVGVRLERPDDLPPLTRRDSRELATEGMPLGAVQVPPSGEPVVFLADHPITGGYPVIGVVSTADVSVVAQARPGQQLSFVPGRARAADRTRPGSPW